MRTRPGNDTVGMHLDLWNHVDYRTFLKGWFESQKEEKSWVSYRSLAAKLDMDAGQLAKILHGQRHLSAALLPKVITLLELEGQEAEGFRHLVHFTKARTASEIRTHFEAFQALRHFQPTVVATPATAFFADWRLPALRALLSFHKWDGDWAALGHRVTPVLTARQAQEGVDRLVELGFLKAVHNGWEVADPFVTTGDAWKAESIRAFQLQTLDLAQHSLVNHPKEIRDISTLTLSIPRSGLPALKEQIAKFRETVLKMVKEMDEPDLAVQLNLQLFPLSLPEVSP